MALLGEGNGGDAMDQGQPLTSRNKQDLLTLLTELKTELASLRVAKIAGGSASKVTKMCVGCLSGLCGHRHEGTVWKDLSTEDVDGGTHADRFGIRLQHSISSASRRAPSACAQSWCRISGHDNILNQPYRPARVLDQHHPALGFTEGEEFAHRDACDLYRRR